MKIDYTDLIINYYKDKVSSKKTLERSDSFLDQKERYAITFNNGIGDSVVINQLLFETESKRSNIHIKSYSDKFFQISQFNKFIKTNFYDESCPEQYRTEVLEDYNLGSGHLIQKMRKFFNLPVLNKPKSFLETGEEKIKNRIGLHLSVGASAMELSKFNSFPRQIYKQNIDIIQKFINEHPEYQFVEFGGQSVGLTNCIDYCGQTMSLSIKELSKCEYFIGLNSGFMNLAACFDIKSIIILNIPINPSDIVLPVLKDIRVPDMNWLYPQNVHLHQDGKSDLVPLFNYENILKAINGEIYPFWTEKYLDLIYG
jgi:hypothetical protein